MNQWDSTSPSFELDAQRRFWSRVRKADDGCWLWTGIVDKDGYGVFSYRYSNRRAHRMAYEWARGEFSGILRHTCDVPGCVNPDHLIPGTAKDNTHDAIKRGRFPFGHKNGNSKLSDIAILAIRAELSKGKSHRSIAKRFRVTHRVVGLVAHGQRIPCHERTVTR